MYLGPAADHVSCCRCAVGILAAHCAQHRGARRVILIDNVEYRLEHAKVCVYVGGREGGGGAGWRKGMGWEERGGARTGICWAVLHACFYEPRDNVTVPGNVPLLIGACVPPCTHVFGPLCVMCTNVQSKLPGLETINFKEKDTLTALR